MVTRTYRKLLRRGVRKSLTRFLSILAIVGLGVGFLSGLLATTPDMQLTADQYLDAYRLFDVAVKATDAAGLSEDDLDAMRALPGVETVMGAFVYDAIMDNASVTRIYAVDLEKHGSDAFLNDFKLIEGRMPENDGEALALIPNGYVGNAHSLPETYRFSEDNENYALLPLLFTFDTVQVVGFVESPYYLSYESEPSSVGSGRVGLVLYVPDTACRSAVYTDAFLTMQGGREADTFSDAYFDKADALTERLTAMDDSWYVTDRRDNIGFASYRSNTRKIDAIARVFPVFFFFVAALVALTTMTRMVEEERLQIGTLRALGYSRGAVLFYYLGYSILAALLGGLAGSFAGFYTLPRVISRAYTMLYVIPPLRQVFHMRFAAVIIPIAVGCTTAATLWACLGTLSEKPAALMLPKSPKAGKRVFLEYIRPLWRAMGFIQKVTARNILRYKKRFFMTVIGIAGCCALLVTGFGLRDSISDIVHLQFDEIYQYNLSVTLRGDGSEAAQAPVAALLEAEPTVDRYAYTYSGPYTVETESGSERITLTVPKETEELSRMFRLRRRGSHEAVPFDGDSFVLTEKLCETLHIAAGDTVTLVDSDGNRASLRVSGITENYLMGAGYLGAPQFEAAFGRAPAYNQILVRVTDESEAARDALSKELLAADGVNYVQFSQSIRDNFSESLDKIDYVIMVLLLSAAALALIVLYNLTNINICERTRELATVRVLGFRDRELAMYIYRETFVLSLIGTLFGLLFGRFLHRFVVRTAEVDSIMFGREIAPLSYLLAALLTLLFTVLVDLLMLRRLRRIDMVESLRSGE